MQTILIRNLRPRALAASLLLGLLAQATGAPALADPAAFDAELLAIQTDWATANYALPKDQREAAFEKLSARAAAFSQQYPGRAEPLVWEGIVLSTYAGVKGGLGALGLCKDSRDRLEASIRIDPDALQGSAHTSLAVLYHKVPGFPLGFGSNRKAAEQFDIALRLNPDGIDPNFFYGEFLYDQGDYAGALAHLQKALEAPPRPARASADEGRRREIQELLAKVRARQS